MVESFPLKWPTGRPRTTNYHRKNATFKTTLGKARDELLAELKRLGATNVVISSNVTTYTRGGQTIMYADQSAAKDDPGVAVYYLWKGEQYALACDKWTTVMDNLQALNKTVDAIRGVERWGTGEMMKAAFSGFKELPVQPEKKSCWVVLGIYKTSNIDAIKEAYRNKAKVVHPDAGGSNAAMQELNDAYREAMNQ